MSLYSMNEICKGCKYAIFHKCCENFCRCTIGWDLSVNHYKGTCDYFKEDK
jgi:hypothetical protein